MGLKRGVQMFGSAHANSCIKHIGESGRALLLGNAARSSFGGVRQATRGYASPASDKYDYILVGGGTAGCVLANRLTADGSKKVLVLEAGGDNKSLKIKTPAALTQLFKSGFDWNMYTKDQSELGPRQLYLARGKVLGGSSSTNATLYMRGSREDYDAWGIPAWSSNRALDGFIKCEDNDNGLKDQVHGVGGPMHVENPRYQNEMHGIFFQAAAEVGMPKNDNFNDWGQKQEGYGEFQVCQEKGVRADAYRQYLKPAMGRSNLTILTESQTLGVEMDNSRSGQPVARGVSFQQNGPDSEKHFAELTADGEVIMCAGAIHTPHLLQLSGIGNGKDLSRHDVPVRVDLPGVGENLLDHPAALASYICKKEWQPKSITDEMVSKKGNIRVSAVLNYLLRGRGPLTSTGCDHGALVNTRGDGGQPDLQMRFVPAAPPLADGVNAYAEFGKIRERGEYWPGGWTLQLLGVRPKSVGRVVLRSDDPYDAPRMDPRYLSDAEGADLRTLREGIKLSRRIAETSAMKPITDHELHPGTKCQSDAEINDFIQKTLHSGNAVVGTCAMGLDPSQGAVVDADLKVYGVGNLRVADASIIPVIPGGQTGAATVMVAERAAEILLAKASSSSQDYSEDELAVA